VYLYNFIFIATLMILQYILQNHAIPNSTQCGVLLEVSISNVSNLISRAQVKHPAKRGLPRKAFRNEITNGGVSDHNV
jgi:hypothetical protein